MIPLSGILSRAFSTRYLFAFSCAGFTVMSFMCSTASDINQMIVYRALQGFIGGGDDPDRLRLVLHDLPAGQAADHRAGHRPRRDAGADHRPDRRRLPHGPVLLALAVSGQRRAGHHRDADRPMSFDRLRQAGPVAPGAVRLVRASPVWPPSSARWNMCWRRGLRKTGSTKNIVTRVLHRLAGRRQCVFFWRAFTAPQPIVDLKVFYKNKQPPRWGRCSPS